MKVSQDTLEAARLHVIHCPGCPEYHGHALADSVSEDAREDFQECMDDYVSPRGYLCTLGHGHKGPHEARAMFGDRLSLSTYDEWDRGTGHKPSFDC